MPRVWNNLDRNNMFVTDPIGIIGETEAAKMLEQKGFRIVEHNWRMGHLEVDLIAENKKEIVFAEVKARTTTYGGKMPEEYVDEDKKRRCCFPRTLFKRTLRRLFRRSQSHPSDRRHSEVLKFSFSR